MKMIDRTLSLRHACTVLALLFLGCSGAGCTTTNSDTSKNIPKLVMYPALVDGRLGGKIDFVSGEASTPVRRIDGAVDPAGGWDRVLRSAMKKEVGGSLIICGPISADGEVLFANIVNQAAKPVELFVSKSGPKGVGESLVVPPGQMAIASIHFSDAYNSQIKFAIAMIEKP